MPLSERARVEVYLPDLPSPAYQELLESLEQEFTYTFGGCTLVRGLGGNYLSQLGLPVQDRISLLHPLPSNSFRVTACRYANMACRSRRTNSALAREPKIPSGTS